MSESLRDSADAAQTPAQPWLKAWSSPAAWARFLIPAAIGLAGDLWLKAWAFPAGVPSDSAMMLFAGRNPGGNGHEPWPVIPKVLGFTTTVNQGAVFGIGQGK